MCEVKWGGGMQCCQVVNYVPVILAHSTSVKYRSNALYFAVTECLLLLILSHNIFQCCSKRSQHHNKVIFVCAWHCVRLRVFALAPHHQEMGGVDRRYTPGASIVRHSLRSNLLLLLFF